MVVFGKTRQAVKGVEVNVLFGNEARHLYVVPWDDVAIEKLIDQEREFWQLVEKGEPPAARSPEDARRIWVKTDGTSKLADPYIARVCTQLRDVKALIKNAEVQGDMLETEIESFMAEASTLMGADGTRLATWNAAKPARRIDVDKLREKYPAIAEECTKLGDPTRRFLLK